MLANAYRIETERLIIRCYDPKDAELLKISIDESLEHLRPWMPWARNEPEILETKVDRLRKYRGEFDLGLDYKFGIFSKDQRTLIGSCGLHTRLDQNAREIGYWINGKYVKQGYATEATTALIIVGFEIEQLDRLEIRCASDNIPSQLIPRKLGFIHEGTLKNKTIDEGGILDDIMIWTMFRVDYLQMDFSNFNITSFNIVDKRIL